MKRRLHWKLLIITTLPVIAVILGIIWLAFDQLAADYFMVLMDEYMVSPTDTHRAFLDAVHRYLLWAGLIALLLAFLLSYLLTRRVLKPLSEMIAVSSKIADGDFSARVATTTNDEIGELGLAFNRMGDSLEKLEKLRKTMVADVAHELRTPLTNLRGYLEGLSDGIIPANREILEMLQQENLRLVSLVEDLGQLAKADAAGAYLKLQKVPLNECLKEILTLYQMNFSEKGIEIITSFADHTEVSADRDKLLQAIRNLVENCWKYTPSGGTVTISCLRDNRDVVARFLNTGPGIPEQDMPFIFERFFRSDPSRSREAGGAGIGLAIVKELIEAHGGKVGASSTREGTCIWFSLPAH